MTQMTENNIENPGAAETPKSAGTSKPYAAWVSLLLTIAAWACLLWLNGYIALGIAAAAAITGFCGIPHRSSGAKRLAITAIIAAIVLIVVVSAFLVVIKIGLS